MPNQRNQNIEDNNQDMDTRNASGRASDVGNTERSASKRDLNQDSSFKNSRSGSQSNR